MRVIEYVLGGAVLLAYVAYRASTPERRRRWLARINAPSSPALDSADPLPPSLLDDDAGGHHHDHHDHHDHSADSGGHHGDFDMGGGHHH